jgi:hypothetical protein
MLERCQHFDMLETMLALRQAAVKGAFVLHAFLHPTHRLLGF